LAVACCLILAVGTAQAAPDEAAIRAEVSRVYNRPEFRADEGDSDFDKAIRAFLAKLGTLHDDAPALFWLVLIGCILLLCLLVGHIVWTIVRAVHIGRRPGLVSHAEARRRLSAGFRLTADLAAEAGDYTEAVRNLFLSLVYAFDEGGRVPFKPSLTNREYLHFFDDRPAISRSLGVFVNLLDANWYGERHTGPEDYEQCRSLFERVQRGGD
jgi:hypothetical protein